MDAELDRYASVEKISESIRVLTEELNKFIKNGEWNKQYEMAQRIQRLSFRLYMMTDKGE